LVLVFELGFAFYSLRFNLVFSRVTNFLHFPLHFIRQLALHQHGTGLVDKLKVKSF